jgi:H+-transporting ATPase
LFVFRFNPTDKRTEITYKQTNDGSVHRIKQLNADVDEFAKRGLRALAVAIEDLPNGQTDGKGNGFKLIGLLPIYDPPREDTKETIERALQLGKTKFS